MAHNYIVNRSTSMNPKPPCVVIDGSFYTTDGEQVYVMARGYDHLETCSPCHVASNGTTMAEIVTALGLICGALRITENVGFPGVGMN